MSHVLTPTMRGNGQGMPHRAIGALGRRPAHRIFGRRTRLELFLVVALACAGLMLAPRGLQAAVQKPDDNSQTAASKPDRAAQTVVWRDFTPADWITAVPFTSAVTAEATGELQPQADVYQITTDGGATWSEWTKEGLSVNALDTSTHRITVSNLSLPDSASRNFIRFRMTEAEGIELISDAYPLRVDSKPPAAPINLTANPSTWSNDGSFSVSWTNPVDVTGIAGAWYKLGSAPTSPTDGTFVVTTNSITNIEPAQDGAHVIYVWLEDTLDRADQKNAATTTLYLDTTPPDPPTLFVGSPERQWTNVNRFSVSWRNPYDPSGIVGAYYRLNELPDGPTDGTFVSTVNTITNIQAPYEGRHDLWVWLVDGAGNVDEEMIGSEADIFRYDATPPVSSMTATPLLPATGWYTSNVTVNFTATDLPIDPAYPPSMYYQLNNGGWTTTKSPLTFGAEGWHKLQYQARDRASNVEPVKEFSFGIDKTPPTAVLNPDRAPTASGWYTSAVTFTLSVSDTISGLPRGFYRLNDGPWQAGPVGSPATFSLVEGSYRIEYYGQDAAGNRSIKTSMETLLDSTAPTTIMAVEGAAGENHWYSSAITVTLTPQDNGSGAVSTHYRIDDGEWKTGAEFVLSGEGTHELAYYSVDAAGNIEKVITAPLRIDKTAPAAPNGLIAAPTGWSRTNSFTVEWTSPSDLSGVTGAYYKLGDLSGGGAPTGPKDGTHVAQSEKIEGLTLPSEGSYRLYLWLHDAAGNADHKTAAGRAVLRYDATPPLTFIQAQGTPGENGWWLSPMTVTLTASDSASGVAALYYRLDGGAWQTTNTPTATVFVNEPDKHVIEYYAQDIAGNFESTQQFTARLDFAPPVAPTLVRVQPSGWTRFNSFRIDWSTVTDLSNIGGAYVKFNQPPVHATDGVFYEGSTQINGVRAPREGKHSVYIWLRDGAGNASHTAAVAINDAVWYDGTPPTTTVKPSAAAGLNGWYVESVTFDVTAKDTASGLLEIHYQVDDGPVKSALNGQLPPQTMSTTARFVVSDEGRHTVRVWGVDGAGNVEDSHVFEIAIDRTAPRSSFTGPAGPTSRTEFDVSWTGFDDQNGSGLASYDVQMRDGLNGQWQDWLFRTTLTSARFQAQRGHQYTFRVYGRDHAGNRQVHPSTMKLLVQPVLNGGFEAGNFSNWTVNGLLFSSVVATTGPGDTAILAAKLGSDTLYSPSTEPPGNVPPGCAVMSQPVTIPNAQQVQRPRLRFWYRVLTYDVMWSDVHQDIVDTLDVTLTTPEGETVALLLRAGNPTSEYGKLYDTGWQFADLDLRPYAGWSGVLKFANCNGPRKSPDNLMNTWSYVDSIRIVDSSLVHLPVLNRAALPGEAEQVAEEWQPAAAKPEGIDLLR